MTNNIDISFCVSACVLHKLGFLQMQLSRCHKNVNQEFVRCIIVFFRLEKKLVDIREEKLALERQENEQKKRRAEKVHVKPVFHISPMT